MSVNINRDNWSRSSRRSFGGQYDDKATEYEAIAYVCRKCGTSTTYTATQQKHDYEVLKKYVWRVPSLCNVCESERDRLKSEIIQFQMTWKENKDVLSGNMEFLEEWRTKLKEIALYGRKGSNPANIIMINRLIEKLILGDSS
jgi:hypothetical protein